VTCDSFPPPFPLSSVFVFSIYMPYDSRSKSESLPRPTETNSEENDFLPKSSFESSFEARASPLVLKILDLISDARTRLLLSFEPAMKTVALSLPSP